MRHNEAVLSKLINKNDLNFEELYIAKPHVFISNNHPLANKEEITIRRLNAVSVFGVRTGKTQFILLFGGIFEFTRISKNIMVRDRATLFNLLIGLNGFTVCWVCRIGIKR